MKDKKIMLQHNIFGGIDAIDLDEANLKNELTDSEWVVWQTKLEVKRKFKAIFSNNVLLDKLRRTESDAAFRRLVFQEVEKIIVKPEIKRNGK